MISFDNVDAIHLSIGYTDLRLGIDGYAKIVQDRFKLNCFDNAIFLFCNKQRNKIKILYWDKNGFWLLYKRLENGHFKWIRDNEKECVLLTKQQLNWLLDGLKIEQKNAFKALDYKYV